MLKKIQETVKVWSFTGLNITTSLDISVNYYHKNEKQQLVRKVKPKVGKRLQINLGYILHKKIKSHFSLRQCYISVPAVTILPISQLLINNLQTFII